MYKKNVQGWLKHIDFIIWDILVLQVSFILGYMIRHGWGRWPYLRADYRSLAIVLIVVDFLVAALFNSMHDVLKRGYLKELIASARHVVLTLVIMTTYLFSTQTGDTYSRITLYLTAGLHLVGEAGAELVRFKGGEQVYNAQDTQKILSGAGGQTFNYTFNNLQDTSAYAMMKQLKAYDRQMAIDGIL